MTEGDVGVSSVFFLGQEHRGGSGRCEGIGGRATRCVRTGDLRIRRYAVAGSGIRYQAWRRMAPPRVLLC